MRKVILQLYHFVQERKKIKRESWGEMLHFYKDERYISDVP